jgi:copper chaperone
MNKKREIMFLALVVGFALFAAAYVGHAKNCPGESAGGGSTVGSAAPKSCPASKYGEENKSSTDAKTVNAQAATSGCAASGMMSGAKLTCADHPCDYNGKCAALTLSVKGMTCAGCENKVIEALKSDKGVIKVVSVDYKTGKAIVCYDPEKVEQGKLAALVTNAGYASEIMQATAGSTPANTGKGATCDIMSGKCAADKADIKKDEKESSH